MDRILRETISSRWLSHEHIMLKVALSLCPVWIDHLTIPMLNPILPLPFVDRSIIPKHLSVTMTLILLERSLVYVPSGPLINSFPMFHVI